MIGMVATLALTGGADNGCKPGRKKPKDSGPPVDVTAKQLHDDYQANEVRADQMYRDRMLRVTGKVSAIKKDVSDDPYVTISTGNDFESVRAEFSGENALGDLRAGHKITVRCIGNNVILGSPRLTECVLESDSATIVGEENDAIRKMTKLTDQMCTCTDKACADRVQESMTAWSIDMASQAGDVEGQRADEATMKKMTEVGQRYGECMTKAMSR